MKITLKNKNGSVDIEVEKDGAIIHDDSGKSVIENPCQFYQNFNFFKAKSYMVVMKLKKQSYEVENNVYTSLLSIYGGAAFVTEEMKVMFKGGYVLPTIMLLLGLSPFYYAKTMLLTDYMIVVGSIAHFGLSYIGKKSLSLDVFGYLTYFNLYYLVFWAIIGFSEDRWLFPGIMIGLMLLFYFIGQARWKTLKEISSIGRLGVGSNESVT